MLQAAIKTLQNFIIYVLILVMFLTSTQKRNRVKGSLSDFWGKAVEIVSEKKMQKVSVVEQVVAYIQEMIDSGTWTEGERIESEAQMAEKLGVSKVTVRSAVRQFIALGRLESFQGKGTFVKGTDNLYFPNTLFRSQSKAGIRQVMQVRTTIEQDTAYFASKNPCQEDLDFLRENLALMLAADRAGEPVSSCRHDVDFHLKIAQMAGNPYYYTILSWIFSQAIDQIQEVVNKIGTRYANHFHPAILDAIASRDAELARELMRAHLLKFVTQLNK